MKHHVYFPPDEGIVVHCETCPCMTSKQNCDESSWAGEDWAYCRTVSDGQFFLYTLTGIREEKDIETEWL